MTDEERGFQSALDSDPLDMTTRLVFADWLQDRDDPRAAGYRALVALDRQPYYTHFYSWGEWAVHREVDKSVLPEAWITKLFEIFGKGKVTITSLGCYAGWYRRHEAEDAAALAFSKLTQEQQAEILGVVV